MTGKTLIYILSESLTVFPNLSFLKWILCFARYLQHLFTVALTFKWHIWPTELGEMKQLYRQSPAVQYNVHCCYTSAQVLKPSQTKRKKPANSEAFVGFNEEPNKNWNPLFMQLNQTNV